MSEYIGSVGSKISVEVTYKRDFEYQTHYTYYGETHYIRLFEDADGNCIVWNTQSGIVEDKKLVDENGMTKTIYHGSKVLLTGTVKEHSEYKGTKQTVVSRPRFKLIEIGKSPEEIQREREEAKKQKIQEQMDSIAENDFIWHMPYKQYKEHYADCETVFDSYDKETGEISVIIREGRLKNSGVRGEHYKSFEFTADDGTKHTYYAISEETARRRMKKEFPGCGNWECTRIYDHQRLKHRIW